MVVPQEAAALPICRLISQQSEMWNIVMASEMTPLLWFESARTMDDASLLRFINFYGGRGTGFEFHLNGTTINVSRRWCFRDFHRRDSRVHRLPSTGSNKRQPRRNVSSDYFFFLRSSVRTNFTIGTPVCGADRHLLTNVGRQAIPLNVKNSDSNVPSCLALHLSVSLPSYDTPREFLSWLRRFSAHGSIIVPFKAHTSI